MTDTGYDEGAVEYEEGDINTVAPSAEADDTYDDTYDEVDDDVVDEGDDAGNVADRGNRVQDATSVAVLTYVAKALASDPESVVVESESHRNGVRLRLHVAPEDMGRVIGRRGRTAQAIRTLVGVAGAADGVTASVDIEDD
jgi:hypothetical protein